MLDAKRMTNNFEKEIGRGGFASVYLGKWNDQQVAVKRLKMAKETNRRSSWVRKQFHSEMASLLSCPPHPNLAKLLGYSCDGPELCLIFQYVDGGTLAKNLSKRSKDVLSAKRRVEIMIDIVQGILHIQTESRAPLIHRDLKSSNVMLGLDNLAHIMDFGLACSICEDELEEKIVMSGSTIAGTRFYMPPEATKGTFSRKTDIFPLGMIMYELLTGLRPYSPAKKTDLVMYSIAITTT
ncbi:interleukin-1 receptor-associated kinase 4-like [Oscarella lobularis]|uniref:interleukin-1 receptor-associated kinase 4-like n=1 Tax=Oscarella lobularis TaxID=121494 RepID=UPI0033136E2C